MGYSARTGFRVRPGMTRWAGVERGTSIDDSNMSCRPCSPRSLDARDGEVTVFFGFRVKPGMTWVWGWVVVYRLFCPDWIPGRARNDVVKGDRLA